MRTVLAERGPQRRRFVVKLNEFRDNRLLDLRFYYFDDKAREFRPTHKGINLNRENYLLLRRVIGEQDESVMDWLGIGYVPEHVEKYTEAQQQATEERAYALGTVVTTVDKRERDPTFFQVDHLGGSEEVNLNSAHPFVQRLTEASGLQPDQDGPVWELLAALLAAFSKAQVDLEDSSTTHPSVLFDSLVYNWSRYLEQYLDEDE